MFHLRLLIILATSFFTTRTQAQSNFDILIVAHRGANHLAPENTFASAQKCIDMGVQYVEIDVRMSVDSVYFIMHDRTVNRTTNGSGAIGEMTADEIRQLDAGSWFSDEFIDEPVPQLDEYLEWIKGKAKVYLDVKSAHLPSLVKLVKDAGMEKDVFFWFGDNSLEKEFAANYPDIPQKVNAGNSKQVKNAKKDLNAEIIECRPGDISKPFFDYCRKEGVLVMVYASSNNEEEFRQIIESGADMVNLDKPSLFIEVLNEMKK